MHFNEVLESWNIIKNAPTIYCGCGSDVYTRFSYDCRIIEKALNELKLAYEMFGCDLNVVIKALLNGVWFKNGNEIVHKNVFLCETHGNLAFGYEWSYKYGLQGWCLETKCYKKHWALTKEELLFNEK